MSAATDVYALANDYATDTSVYGLAFVYSADSEPDPVVTRRIAIVGTSQRRVTLQGTSRQRRTLRGTSP